MDARGKERAHIFRSGAQRLSPMMFVAIKRLLLYTRYVIPTERNREIESPENR
jgi:hypothetical protein